MVLCIVGSNPTTPASFQSVVEFAHRPERTAELNRFRYGVCVPDRPFRLAFPQFHLCQGTFETLRRQMPEPAHAISLSAVQSGQHREHVEGA